MRKNKDGYYRETFVIPGKTDRGNPKRHTVRAKSKAEFDKRVEEFKRLYGKGISLEQTTVEEWSERWLKIYKANATQSQKNHYAAKVKRDILPSIGNMNIKDVRTSHLQELLNKYNGRKNETVKKLRIAINQLFEDAETEGLIERNPARKLELPETTESPRRPLTELERAVVYEVAKTHKCGAYVLTMLFCGLRRGECLALTVGDINFNQKYISITKALNLQQNIGYLTGTKAENMRKKKIKSDENIGKRETPLPDILAPALMAQCRGKKFSDILFPKSDGKHATNQTSRWWWKSFMRSVHVTAGAKLYRHKVLVETSPFDDDITPHYLRHTYATAIYAADVDNTAQKYFLGHSSNDVTDRYRKVTAASFERASNLINDYYLTLNFNYKSLLLK